MRTVEATGATCAISIWPHPLSRLARRRPPGEEAMLRKIQPQVVSQPHREIPTEVAMVEQEVMLGSH